MSSKIMTNKLDYKLSKENLFERYDIIQVKTSKDYFSYGAYILDLPSGQVNVRSVCFDGSNKFYILMAKNENNMNIIHQAIQSSDEYPYISLLCAGANEVPEYVILNLLLYALCNFQTPSLAYENLTGHMYCFHSKWLCKAKEFGKEPESEILQVPCLEFKITKDFNLAMYVRTFTSVKLQDSIRFKKKPLEAYVRYALTGNNTLRRLPGKDDPNGFILRQIRHRKNAITYFDIKNLNRFSLSKIGVLNEIVNEFNFQYADIAHLDFSTIPEWESVSYTSILRKESAARIHDLLLKKKIRVVDLINDESSSYICYKTEECLHKLYDTKANCIEVEIGNTPCESCYNLCLIHEKKFFKEIPDEDSYSTYTGMSIQHITIEKFQDFVDAAINSVVHELLIKDDIANQKISLYDWPSLNLSSAVDFGVRVVDDKKTPHFFFINILPDGSFSLFEKTLDLFGSSRYDKMILALQGNSNDKGKSDAPHILGAVCGSNEHINTIWNTPNFTLPNFSDIHKELASGNTFLRGKEYKETLFSACLDIKYFEKDGAVYYFVGKISQNVGYKFHVAANIRKIVAFRDHPLFFTSLLPLMNITFVHNGQLSAIPFPFKYLREYIASVISLPIEEDDNDDSDDTSN